jgi:TRAP-type C4-dicarboxylate transport system permease small subunit
VIDRWLHRASNALALLGGLVLLAAAALTLVSILGRWLLDAPILGDIELMQIACVAAIALFLPWCQWRAEHVRVDFFTEGAGPRLRGLLDRIGHLLLAVVMALLAWRAADGLVDLRASGESTMLLAIPAWLAYLPLLPGLALSALIAMYAAWTGEVGDATLGEVSQMDSTALPHPRSLSRGAREERPISSELRADKPLSPRERGWGEGAPPPTRDVPE